MIKKKIDTFKIFLYFLDKYKLHFTFLILLSVIIGIFESLNVAILYPILSNGLGTNISNNVFLNFIDLFIKFIPMNDELVKYCILFIIFAFTVFLAKIIYFFFSVKIITKILIETKQKIFNKCITYDYQFFIDNKQGEILYKISRAPGSIVEMLNIMSNVFVELVLSISIIILLFSMSFKASILIISGGIGYYYLTKYLSIKIHYIAGKKMRESGQKETIIINEFATGIKQIKIFATFPYWKNIFDNAMNTFRKYHRKGFFWTKVPEILLMMLIYLSVGVSVIFIKLQSPSSFLSTLPLIGTFAFAIFMILPKLAKFGSYRMSFMQSLPNIKSVYDMLKEKKYSEIQNGNKEFKKINSNIKLQNVTFNYKNRDILLENISLEIKKDNTVALVGSSGSGKSTIANLILRLFDINSGCVYIDDINIKEYDIFSFLNKIGYVSQDTFIFHASINENIAFGGNYTDEEIINASKLANADDFIQGFPEKYKTIVGDQGINLSGGEKQRIAIARAMIRKPEILILDEATSSLDNISENIVQNAINNVSKNCTTLIIAHRLSTIQNADVIYVLDKGAIVESGKHQELLDKKGKYWELYNIQNVVV